MNLPLRIVSRRGQQDPWCTSRS